MFIYVYIYTYNTLDFIFNLNININIYIYTFVTRKCLYMVNIIYGEYIHANCCAVHHWRRCVQSLKCSRCVQSEASVAQMRSIMQAANTSTPHRIKTGTWGNNKLCLPIFGDLPYRVGFASILRCRTQSNIAASTFSLFIFYICYQDTM